MNPKSKLKIELSETEEFSLPTEPNTVSFNTKPRRTKITSLGDILRVIKEAGREGVIISTISRRANLAHYMAMEKCHKLISAGLIEQKIVEKRNVFLITEKGFNFLEEYGLFQKLVEPLNLRF